MIKKVYVAASYPRRAEAQGLMALLELSGVAVTSWWLREETKEGYEQANMDHMAGAAARDIADVIEADTIICLTDGKVQLTRGGRHAEFGLALGLGKTCIIVGPREQVMHYHRDVISYDNIGALLESCGCRGQFIPLVDKGKDIALFNEEAREFAGSTLGEMYVYEITMFRLNGHELARTVVWSKSDYIWDNKRCFIDQIKQWKTKEFEHAVAVCKTHSLVSIMITKDECDAS